MKNKNNKSQYTPKRNLGTIILIWVLTGLMVSGMAAGLIYYLVNL